MQWSILFATRKPLCSSHTNPMKCKPHFFSPCTSLVYLSKFRKYFMYGRDETWFFLRVTPWWLGLGWHQRRPAFTSCSAIGFLCKVSLNALHFHMDTTASAGVASGAVTHTAGADISVKVDKTAQECLLYFSSYMETCPSTFGYHKSQSALMQTADGLRRVRKS